MHRHPLRSEPPRRGCRRGGRSGGGGLPCQSPGAISMVSHAKWCALMVAAVLAGPSAFAESTSAFGSGERFERGERALRRREPEPEAAADQAGSRRGQGDGGETEGGRGGADLHP